MRTYDSSLIGSCCWVGPVRLDLSQVRGDYTPPRLRDTTPTYDCVHRALHRSFMLRRFLHHHRDCYFCERLHRQHCAASHCIAYSGVGHFTGKDSTSGVLKNWRETFREDFGLWLWLRSKGNTQNAIFITASLMMRRPLNNYLFNVSHDAYRLLHSTQLFRIFILTIHFPHPLTTPAPPLPLKTHYTLHTLNVASFLSLPKFYATYR